MLQRRFVSFIIFVYLLHVQLYAVEGRPQTKKIVVDGHEWTVPDEPGWEDGKFIISSSTTN